MQAFRGRTRDNQGPPYQNYSADQLRQVALRARLALQTRALQILEHITNDVAQLAYVANDYNTLYRMLKFIAEEAVELESIKLVNAKLSRIEELSASIVNTNGELSPTSSEFCYFQSVEWLRVSKYIDQLVEFHKFCYDFFRGKTITADLNAQSLLFQKYPILKYIRRQQIIPLNEVFGYVQPYLKIRFQGAVLQQVFRLNKQDINNKANAPVSQGFFNVQGQYGYTAFQNQGNMQNSANYHPGFQVYEPNNYNNSNDYNQNTQQMDYFNRYAGMNNNNNNNVSNFGQQSSGFNNYDPYYNNTLNLPMDPSFFGNANFNKQEEEALRKERQLKEKKQKEEAERKAKFLQQQSILQKKMQQLKIKEENERKIKQQEERKEREQSQRDKQFEARRLARQKEERQQQLEINVFADNEREGPDREASGRFSNNFGMKVDFGQNPGEQFNYQSPNQVNNSLLRFSKQPEQKES